MLAMNEKMTCKISRPFTPFFGNLTLLVQKQGFGQNYENTSEMF